MKEFKKWLTKNVLETSSGIRYDSINEDLAAEEGWRAALEMVLEIMGHEYDRDYAALTYDIKQELEN